MYSRDFIIISYDHNFENAFKCNHVLYVHY